MKGKIIIGIVLLILLIPSMSGQQPWHIESTETGDDTDTWSVNYRPEPKFLGIYGEMWNYSANATSWDFIFEDEGVYYNLSNLSVGEIHGFNFTGNPRHLGGSYLTAEYSGLYIASATISMEGTGKGLYGIGLVKNFQVGTHRNCYARRSIASPGDIGSITISCIMDITKGDNINVQIENELSPLKDVKIHTVNINIIKLGE